jgi:hypothetical protein
MNSSVSSPNCVDDGEALSEPLSPAFLGLGATQERTLPQAATAAACVAVLRNARRFSGSLGVVMVLRVAALHSVAASVTSSIHSSP